METPQAELMKVASLMLVHLSPRDIGQLTDANAAAGTQTPCRG